MTWATTIAIGCDPRWAEEDDSIFDWVHLVLAMYYGRISPTFIQLNGIGSQPYRAEPSERQGTFTDFA